MENGWLTTNKNDEVRELWKRPGGMFAKITGGVALVGGGYVFMQYVLPFLVAATANMLLFVGELIVLAAVLFVVTSKTFLRGISLGWLQLMRKFYGLIVDIDPITVLQNAINKMVNKLEEVNTNVTRLESILVSMRKKYKEYKLTFENNV